MAARTRFRPAATRQGALPGDVPALRSVERREAPANGQAPSWRRSVQSARSVLSVAPRGDQRRQAVETPQTVLPSLQAPGGRIADQAAQRADGDRGARGRNARVGEVTGKVSTVPGAERIRKRLGQGSFLRRGDRMGKLCFLGHVYGGMGLFRCDCGVLVLLHKDPVSRGRASTCGCRIGRARPQRYCRLVRVICQACRLPFLVQAHRHKRSYCSKTCFGVSCRKYAGTKAERKAKSARQILSAADGRERRRRAARARWAQNNAAMRTRQAEYKLRRRYGEFAGAARELIELERELKKRNNGDNNAHEERHDSPDSRIIV